MNAWMKRNLSGSDYGEFTAIDHDEKGVSGKFSDEEFLAFKETSFETTILKDYVPPVLLASTTPPWLNYMQFDRAGNPFVHLHNEILAFSEFISPSTDELRTRDFVLSEISQIIKGLWSESKVQVFGSQMTRILTPASDLDIAVLNVPLNNEDVTEALCSLADRIRESSLASYCEAIANAKVPIVKLDHASTGIAVDICVNNTSGFNTGKLIKKLVKEYPPLRPLTIVLKVFLAQRRLNETYSGGIGSFVLSAMIASFLQMKQMNARFLGQTPNWNLGALLLEFFQLYGCSFNYYLTGISIVGGGQYFPKRKRKAADSQRPNLLFIENPDEADLDMGRNSFLMPKIRRSFEHAAQLLTCALSNPNQESYLAYVVRPDDKALQERPMRGIGLKSNALSMSNLDEHC